MIRIVTAVTWLCAAAALAAEAPAASRETAPEARDDASAIELGGRILAGHLTESSVDASGAPGPWTGRLQVPSARVQVKYRWERLRVVVEGEWEGKPEIKDAFLRLKVGSGLAVRVGQFKMPVSAIEMESLLDLPGARRDLLHEVLVKRMQLAGRRPGLQVEWARELGLPLKLRAGAWQGSGADGSPQPGPVSALFGHNLALRGSVELGKVEAGAWFEWRATELALGRGWNRHGAVGMDLVLATVWGLRGWAELALGSSWLDENVFDDRSTLFFAGRAILAWRHCGSTRGEAYLEAFLHFGAVDPDGEIRDDLVWEAGGGANVGQWEGWRLQIAFDLRRLGRNTPPSLSFGGSPLTDGVSLMVQLAAKF